MQPRRQVPECWGEQMRQVEETIRQELSLLREDVVAVGHECVGLSASLARLSRRGMPALVLLVTREAKLDLVFPEVKRVSAELVHLV
ncbi:MAG: hypothetical protein WBV82_09085 [Myxococcaceae bacterium]